MFASGVNGTNVAARDEAEQRFVGRLERAELDRRFAERRREQEVVAVRRTTPRRRGPSAIARVLRARCSRARSIDAPDLGERPRERLDVVGA